MSKEMDVLEAIKDWIDLCNEIDKAKSEYEGYEFGYHYSALLDRMKDSAKAAKRALRRLCDANDRDE